MKTKKHTFFKKEKNFNYGSVFVRNAITIMLLILIPITIVGTTICIILEDASNKEIASLGNESLLKTQNTIDGLLDTVKRFAIQTSYEQNVESFLYNAYYIKNAPKVQGEIKRNISSFINTHSYIHSVYVYSEKSKLIINNNEINDIDTFPDTEWLNYYQKSSVSDNVLIPRKYNGVYPSLISVILTTGIDGDQKNGCIVINIDVDKINELIYKNTDKQEYLYIVDSANTVYFSPNIKMVGLKYTDFSEIFNISQKQNNSSMDYSLKDNYNFFEIKSEIYDITYISAISNMRFSKIIRRSIICMTVIISLLVILTIIITIWISIKTYSPIRNLLQLISPHELNNIRKSKNYNEIELISDNIKNSLDKTKMLEQELQYKLLLLDKAQLYALQTQINPHFINNALETINWTAIEELGIVNNISKMLKSLSKLLSISLNNEKYLIPLKDEMQHANIYVYFITQRYKKNVTFIWDFKEEMMHFQILKLTLQPLLENAIEHGIKPKKAEGEIKIVGEIVGKNLQLSIIDNGIGMSAENLENLRLSINDTNNISGKHIGLRNVNQRIKLVFGNEYGLTIDSEEGTGTTVKIVIPKIDPS